MAPSCPPKQIRSDASACACQEHAASARESEREGPIERRRVPVSGDMPARACQDHTVSCTSAIAHIQEEKMACKAVGSPSEWDTGARYISH